MPASRRRGALSERKRQRRPSEGKTVQNASNRPRVFEPHEVPAIVKDLIAGPGISAADAMPYSGGIGLAAPSRKTEGTRMRGNFSCSVPSLNCSWIDSKVPA